MSCAAYARHAGPKAVVAGRRPAPRKPCVPLEQCTEAKSGTLKVMHMKLFTTILAISLLIQPLASAHDASLHKGKATTGEVVSVSDSKMEMKTATGPVTITLNANNKHEHGHNAA